MDFKIQNNIFQVQHHYINIQETFIYQLVYILITVMVYQKLLVVLLLYILGNKINMNHLVVVKQYLLLILKSDLMKNCYLEEEQFLWVI